MFHNRIRFFVTAIAALALCHVLSLAQVPDNPASGPILEIHGQVRFADGGAPANNVLVRLESFDGGGSLSEVFTDRLGKFRFTGLRPAQYSVKVHQPGYRDSQQTVDLQTSSSALVMLQLVTDKPEVSNAARGGIDARVPAAAQKEFEKGAMTLAEGGKDKTLQAIHYFEKAIAIYPQFIAARLELGTAYMDLADWSKAEEVLKQTLEIDKQAAKAMFALSEVYLQQNKISEAEKVLVEGLAIDDRSFLGHLNLARVNWERARQTKDLILAKPALEKSYEEVKRALELNPQLAAAHLLKGNLLLRVARTTEALNEFDEYLRLEPTGSLAAETRVVVDKIRKATTSHQYNGRG